MTPLSILLILISALIHSSWNFFTKRGNFPVEFFFWVFLWGILFYIPFFIGFGVFPSFILQMPPQLWGLSLSSGFIQTVYFLCLIESYRGGDLSLVYPISRSAPLFTQFWAISFIGEVLSAKGILGIGFVMVGLFVISLKGFPFKNRMAPSDPFTSRPYLLALAAAIAASIYSVIDKVGVQNLHPVFYTWLINLWMCIFVGLYLFLQKEISFGKVWWKWKREILTIAIFQNVAYLLILMALQVSKVSYVVAFRQVGALFGVGMGIVFLKESHWKTRITGALILTLGLVLIGLAK
ncbi:MAG: EamA family transporter [Thermodesulfobacteriota bacterium]|nr:EamA family transporter [Thermodesulfobacteriota bacterium]